MVFACSPIFRKPCENVAGKLVVTMAIVLVSPEIARVVLSDTTWSVTYRAASTPTTTKNFVAVFPCRIRYNARKSAQFIATPTNDRRYTPPHGARYASTRDHTSEYPKKPKIQSGPSEDWFPRKSSERKNARANSISTQSEGAMRISCQSLRASFLKSTANNPKKRPRRMDVRVHTVIAIAAPTNLFPIPAHSSG